MHHRKKRAALLAALLATALLSPLPARAVTLTAVNNALLPLEDSTMPARIGGELYVPYTVFTAMGVTAVHKDGTLQLSANGQTLTFSPDEGYVYDQFLNSLSPSAHRRNGTIYVPVKLCCGYFKLSYSLLSVGTDSVLRLTDGSGYSDSAFVEANTKRIESAVKNYLNPVPTTPPAPDIPFPPVTPEPTPSTPQPPPPVVPVPTTPAPSPVYPTRISLTVVGMPNSNTAALLDALVQTGRYATFFLPTDDTTWEADSVRRMAAQGHGIGLVLGAGLSDQQQIEQLTQANERLSLLTGTPTRLAWLDTGDTLSADALQAITAQGFRVWQATQDSGDQRYSARRAYEVLTKAFAQTTSPQVLAFHHSANSAALLRTLDGYLGQYGLSSLPLTYMDTPLPIPTTDE